MRTMLFGSIVVSVAVGRAEAQPGATEPQPPAMTPTAYRVPPAYGYEPRPVAITPEEQELLEQGEISDARHVGGVVASIVLGLGLGQAIEGRWSSTGWIFTLGESAATVGFVYGLHEMLFDCGDRPSCESHGGPLMVGGLLAMMGLRVWDIVDALAGPPRHNARLRVLQMRLGYPPEPGYSHLAPYLSPVHGTQGGAVAGLTFRF